MTPSGDLSFDPTAATQFVNGQWVPGGPTGNGGWMSTDGTIYIDKNHLTSFGITDPTTQQFLTNGSTKLLGGQTVYGSGTEGGGWISEAGTTYIDSSGHLENGKLDPNGNFLEAKVVNNQVLYGNPTGDGGWMSTDGTVYVDKNEVTSYGITDPTTQQFLANGSAKLIDGQTIYGSGTEGGGWLSEAGTTYIDSSGNRETGRLDPNGNFLEARNINGTIMYGNATQDNGWMSTDGTIYSDKNNVVTYGITDPTTQQFLANGSTKLLDGQTVYGSGTEGGGWLSEAGTTYIDSSGNRETGKLDANGDFLVARNINGTIMYGNATQDNGWMSTDGTIYSDKNNVITRGITDPTTHQFLADGSEKLIAGQWLYGSGTDGGGWLSEGNTIYVDSTGNIEYGKLDANGDFLESQNVKGTIMYGNATNDGGWMSLDGTIYVDKHGVVTYGITDPVTKQFLPDGSEKLIAGQWLYGSGTQGGGWLSESGTIFVTAANVIEYGMLDAAGDFLEEKTVNGVVMYGNATDNGGWIDQTGTIYVDKNGVITKGITDPVTKQFLPNGVIETVNGAPTYGYMAGKDFISENGTMVYLPATNTVLTGSLDSSGQIFTTASGATYVVTTTGIDPATYQPSDGSYLLGDGQIVMTAHSWAVDLPLFESAITSVNNESVTIADQVTTISDQLSNIQTNWVSPAGDSFAEVVTSVNSALTQLNDVLSAVVSRMRLSYTQYIAVETGNSQNVSGN